MLRLQKQAIMSLFGCVRVARFGGVLSGRIRLGLNLRPVLASIFSSLSAYSQLIAGMDLVEVELFIRPCLRHGGVRFFGVASLLRC
jgi:hypothetical protein